MLKDALTEEKYGSYAADGYILIKGMLSTEETSLLGNAAREDRVPEEHSFGKADGEGGTVLFFHANLLHRSDRNRSDKPRWSMICCYNPARNDPYKESHHPRYTPLDKVPDRMVLEAGFKRCKGSEEAAAAWLDPESDYSAVHLEKRA